jgi:endonuclease-3
MARKVEGPRQPLSQRRPKVAAGKKGVVSRVGRKATSRPAPNATAKTKLPPTPKRGPKATRRPAPDPLVLYDQLLALYPDAHCELDFATPFQLLVATILSAQCTDRRVNMVTPVLFSRYPTVASLAGAKQEDVEEIIKSTGFFRNKAKSIIAMAGALVDRHTENVPSSLAELVTLPGVGRKTANVILGNAFGINDGVVVDTHVGRLAGRLGLTSETDPVKVEQELMKLFPRDRWTMLAHLLIFHGRRVCEAKKPRCSECALAAICPSAGIGS